MQVTQWLLLSLSALVSYSQSSRWAIIIIIVIIIIIIIIIIIVIVTIIIINVEVILMVTPQVGLARLRAAHKRSLREEQEVSTKDIGIFYQLYLNKRCRIRIFLDALASLRPMIKGDSRF